MEDNYEEVKKATKLGKFKKIRPKDIIFKIPKNKKT